MVWYVVGAIVAVVGTLFVVTKLLPWLKKRCV
eukprot:COSAG01_NODE_416_length_17299_cov_62.219186_9_plen_32_part_00